MIKRFCCFAFLSFFANESFSFWMLHGSCLFEGCGLVRAKSIQEFCEITEIGQNNRNKEKRYPFTWVLKAVEIGPYNSEVNPSAVGRCTFGRSDSSNLYYRGAALISNVNHAGKDYDSDIGGYIDQDSSGCNAGNPVDIDSGEKIQIEKDYIFHVDRSSITINRYYRHKSGIFTNKSSYEKVSLWSLDFSDHITYLEMGYIGGGLTHKRTAKIFIPGYKDLYFVEDGELWIAKNASKYSLEKYTHEQELFWRLKYDNYYEKIFDARGRLVTYKNKNEILKLEYEDIVVDGREYIKQSILSDEDRVFSIVYEKKNPIKILDRNDQEVVSYFYDEFANLIEMRSHKFGTSRSFFYEDINNVNALTGISDGLGVRYISWDYDELGRVSSSSGVGGVNKYSFEYSELATRVTNPLGKDTTYYFQTVNGARKIVSVVGHPTQSCEGANKSYSYNFQGLLSSKTDWKGNVTTYTYNSFGQEISRTEADGTPLARTITTEWHTELPLKTRVVEGGRETVYTYDQSGRLVNTLIRPYSQQ